MTQLMFPFEIDRDATRAAVEERLEMARVFSKFGVVRREAKTTPSWEPREHGPTNAISKTTESIAVQNVDEEARQAAKCEQTLRAVGRLDRRERQIIEKRYLEEAGVFDYQVMMDLDMREGRYYKIKSSAVYNLAFALRLEVYKQDQEK